MKMVMRRSGGAALRFLQVRPVYACPQPALIGPQGSPSRHARPALPCGRMERHEPRDDIARSRCLFCLRPHLAPARREPLSPARNLPVGPPDVPSSSAARFRSLGSPASACRHLGRRGPSSGTRPSCPAAVTPLGLGGGGSSIRLFVLVGVEGLAPLVVAPTVGGLADGFRAVAIQIGRASCRRRA